MEASAINDPHPNEQDDAAADEAEAFFGLDDGEGEDEEVLTETPEAKSNVAPEAQAAMDALKPKAGEVAPTHMVAGAERPDPSPPAASAGPTDADAAEPSAAIDHPVESGDVQAAEEEAAVPPEPRPSTTQGTIDREYIVFQRVPLTEKVLKGLLAAIEKGDAPTPRVAYFELHRPSARNPNSAASVAYLEHEKVLGESADLATVSLKSFQEKHISRKPVHETALSIT